MTLASLFNLSLFFLQHEEVAGEHKAGLLDVDTGLIVWTLVTFFLLLVVLSRFVWKPVLTALNTREEGIQTAIERSEQARAEAEQLLAQNKAVMAEAEATRSKMLREAREDGERLRQEQLTALQTDLNRQRDQARLDIGREKDAALAALRTEVANLAISATEKLIEANLDAQKAEQLVNTVLTDLNNSPATGRPTA